MYQPWIVGSMLAAGLFLFGRAASIQANRYAFTSVEPIPESTRVEVFSALGERPFGASDDANNTEASVDEGSAEAVNTDAAMELPPMQVIGRRPAPVRAPPKPQSTGSPELQPDSTVPRAPLTPEGSSRDATGANNAGLERAGSGPSPNVQESLPTGGSKETANDATNNQPSPRRTGQDVPSGVNASPDSGHGNVPGRQPAPEQPGDGTSGSAAPQSHGISAPCAPWQESGIERVRQGEPIAIRRARTLC